MEKPKKFLCIKAIFVFSLLVFSFLSGCSINRGKLEKPEEKKDPSLVIISEPNDVIDEFNKTVTLSIEVTGSGKLNYQWQSSVCGADDTSDGNWVDVTTSGGDTETLSVKILEKAYRYRCVVTAEDGYKAESYAALVKSLDKKATEGAKISVEPHDVKGLLGDDAKLFVKATATGKMKYQWQYSFCDEKNKADGKWVNSTYPGNDSATLEVKIEADTYRYRCVITTENGVKTISYAALVKIGPKISYQPHDTFGELGEDIILTVKAVADGPLKYQWQSILCNKYNKPTGKWTNDTSEGSNTEDLRCKVSPKIYRYRCIITAENGESVASYAALVKFGPKIVDFTANMDGDKYVMTVKAEPEQEIKYQWQYSACDKHGNPTGKWINSTLPGNKTNKLIVKKDSKPYYYRCVVTADILGEKAISVPTYVPAK